MAAEDDEEKLVQDRGAAQCQEHSPGPSAGRGSLAEAVRVAAQITLTSIGDGVISTDAWAEVTFMNGVAEELTGWPQNEAIGRPLPEVFHISNEHTRQPVQIPDAVPFSRERSWGWRAMVLIARDGGKVN